MNGYIGTIQVDENTALLPKTVADAVIYNGKTLSTIVEEIKALINSKGESSDDSNDDTIKCECKELFNVVNVDEDGFFITDANGYIVFKVDENGLDAAIISLHLKSILGTNSESNNTNTDPQPTPSETNKASRPSSGYENFTVSVDYYKDDFGVTNKDVNASTSDGIYTDYGVIALPTNYSATGTPTRLVIMCGGTAERVTSNINPLTNSGLADGGWNHWLNLGYAVMDVNGMSPAWGNAKAFPKTDQHYSNKFLIQSYYKAYKYVVNKYNLYDEVIINGISMGGSASAMLVYSGKFPTLCHCMFAPTISVHKNNFTKPWGYEHQMKTMLGQWNFPDWANTEIKTGDNTYDVVDPTDGERLSRHNYWIKYKDLWIGYDNLYFNTFGDVNAAMTSLGTAEETAFNNLQKMYPCPVKVWHGTSDSIVEYRYSKFFILMIRNAGGKAWWRALQSGSHTDGWKCGSVTLTGINGNFTTSIPFAEAYEFIKRWE